jgi:hypothetical protein
MDAIVPLLFIFLIFILPIFVAGNIAKERGRTPSKGYFLGVFFGWFAVIGLWLALKRRDPKTHMLY